MTAQLTQAVSSRLQSDHYGWLTTVAKSRQPVPRLVWFYLDGTDVIVNSMPNAAKVRLFPLLGGLGLLAVFLRTLYDAASPDYGSGASIAGVGLVLILGLGLIALGVVFMLLMRARQPAFFRGETLRKDTPVLVVDEP